MYDREKRFVNVDKRVKVSENKSVVGVEKMRVRIADMVNSCVLQFG